jgi:hypothetical protein
VSAPLVTTAPPLILSAAQPILQALLDAGLRVAEDVKDINPPCVYYAPPTMRFRFQRNDYECDQTLILCSGNTVKRVQYQELSDLLTTVQDVLGARVVTARPADIWTADQTAVLGAYEVTWTDTIRNRKGAP